MTGSASWVSNTSPLIFLSKIGRLEILRQAAPRILVPPIVLEEIREQDDAATLRVGEAAKSWLEVVEPDPVACCVGSWKKPE